MLKRKELAKQTIILSARQLLANRGFGAVTLQEVLKCASITKGKFFHYFESKEDFFMQVLRSALSEREYLRFSEVAQQSPEKSPFLTLLFLLDRIISWHSEGLPEVMRLCVFATIFFPEEDLGPIRERFASNTNYMRELIVRCQKEQELPDSLDPFILANLIPSCAIGSNTIQFFAGGRDLTPKSLIELKNLLIFSMHH